MGDGKLTSLVEDRVLTFAMDLGGERVGESVSERERTGIVDPEVALRGDVVAGGEQEDPSLTDLPEGRRERRVVAAADDRVHVAGDERPVVPDHALRRAEIL